MVETKRGMTPRADGSEAYRVYPTGNGEAIKQAIHKSGMSATQVGRMLGIAKNHVQMLHKVGCADHDRLRQLAQITGKTPEFLGLPPELTHLGGFLTVRQAAKGTGISGSRIVDGIKRGEVPGAFRWGHRFFVPADYAGPKAWPPPGMITLAEVTALTGLARDTLYKRIQNGEAPEVTADPRGILVPQDWRPRRKVEKHTTAKIPQQLETVNHASQRTGFGTNTIRDAAMSGRIEGATRHKGILVLPKGWEEKTVLTQAKPQPRPKDEMISSNEVATLLQVPAGRVQAAATKGMIASAVRSGRGFRYPPESLDEIRTELAQAVYGGRSAQQRAHANSRRQITTTGEDAQALPLPSQPAATTGGDPSKEIEGQKI